MARKPMRKGTKLALAAVGTGLAAWGLFELNGYLYKKNLVKLILAAHQKKGVSMDVAPQQLMKLKKDQLEGILIGVFQG